MDIKLAFTRIPEHEKQILTAYIGALTRNRPLDKLKMTKNVIVPAQLQYSLFGLHPERNL